jgi:2-polyprenyl-3-methyl-5-hydroxy-6-metoxy-1,4-benzoquinol methylase
MALNVEEKLVQELQNHYGIGPQYARAYLDFLQKGQDRVFTSLQEILSLPAPAPMWFDYALSTNYRGEQLYQTVFPFLPNRSQRYLDIGCGFGGGLVAFGRQGMEVCGVEVDLERIEFSKINCQDYKIRAGVFSLSIVDDHIEDRLDSFDVITCMDVIEHVLDVPKALQNMARLLRPGGVLVLEIPNKDSLFFVPSDGHFNLFGITLLPRAEAIEYQSKFFSFEYDVGYYYPLDFYESEVKKLGLQSQRISSPLHPIREIQETDQLVSQAIRSYMKFLVETQSKVPEKVTQRIKLDFSTYMNHFLTDLSKIPEGTQAIEAFRRRYLTDFWTLMAYKK